MSDSKKENLFAKLAQQNAKAAQDQAEVPELPPTEVIPPSPAPPTSAKAKTPPAQKKTDPVTGKRANPEYCQANAYILKTIRRSVDRALLDIEGLDYSSLVEDLLSKWLKSRRASE
jgi:hypothetical protein